MDAKTEALTFSYVNWRGERSERRVHPIGVSFGSTAWHPEPQWFLEAIDLDKDLRRDFAMKDIVFALSSPEGKAEAVLYVSKNWQDEARRYSTVMAYTSVFPGNDWFPLYLVPPRADQDEIKRLREANAKLHRRCQQAERLHAAVTDTLASWDRSISFIRKEKTGGVILRYALGEMKRIQRRAALATKRSDDV